MELQLAAAPGARGRGDFSVREAFLVSQPFSQYVVVQLLFFWSVHPPVVVLFGEKQQQPVSRWAARRGYGYFRGTGRGKVSRM
jgi:hypothetical protein